jgi:hypothetical protein
MIIVQYRNDYFRVNENIAKIVTIIKNKSNIKMAFI